MMMKKWSAINFAMHVNSRIAELASLNLSVAILLLLSSAYSL